MASIENSNFYVDIQAMKDLEKKYNESIKVLSELYFSFESEVKNIESEEVWQGDSYRKFNENFNKWKMDYLQRLTEIIKLKDFTEDVITTTELLIEDRDRLPSSLEV